ncbi:iron ABC transporter substrate-binding protein [Allofranklinella schreckenbergeri]|uniref:Iron ABC transporter substrate-binding protein n=2 Tax=Allofranklinella schreckenbergeri TaxID=1076744 RepID=A0A3M6R347_9BURK|nr:iron ABC transporter substrate-binding protein [Allofranklinella schreckenbergeri]
MMRRRDLLARGALASLAPLASLAASPLSAWARQPTAQAPSVQAASAAPAAPASAASAQSPSLIHYFGPPLAAPPQRLLASGPPAAVMLAALAPERLLGWPNPLRPEALAMLSPRLRALPTTGSLTGRNSSLSMEDLLARRIDLIVDVGTFNPYYQSLAQNVVAQTGIPYVLVEGRLAQSGRQLRELGALLGAAPRGETLGAYADALLQAAHQQRASRPAAKQPAEQPAEQPSIYLARGADGLETAVAGSINTEVFELAGARNVADLRTGAVVRISLEQLLHWQPDYIVTQQPGLAQTLRQHPAWQSLRAVRQGRVVQTGYLPFGWIDSPPSVNRLMGLRWLISTLHQGRTPADIRQQAAAFYQLFYGTGPDANWPTGALPQSL